MSIKVDRICFAYGEREILKDVSFTAEYGQFLSVLGPNGVGKSTLFRCMLGLLAPSGGTVTIGGTAIPEMTPSQLAREIAYIPQSHSPVFNYTVSDMVLMGTTAQLSRFSAPGRKQRHIALGAMERLGIAHLRDRGYGQISGGERQLTLVARAIAQQAKILVMDEPSANLDFGNRVRVMETVRDLTEDGYCVIQSTHDPDQAYLYSDRILALYEGRVLVWGAPQEALRASVISTLYGVEVEVCSMRGDAVRVCVPTHVHNNRGRDLS